MEKEQIPKEMDNMLARDRMESAGTKPTVEKDTFTPKWRKAFGRLLEDTQYNYTLMRFQEAYLFRSQFPWLGESKTKDTQAKSEDGLAYALRYALERYLVPNTMNPSTKAPVQDIETSASDKHHDSSDPVSNKEQLDIWLGKLKEAIGSVIREGTSLELFKEELAGAGIQTSYMSQGDLQTHIEAALRRYYDHRDIGLSEDPW